MKETQRTISNWAIQTFGVPEKQRSIDRMLEEVEELKDIPNEMNYIGEENWYKVAKECADIYITMCQVADTFGFDLEHFIDEKMKVNRKRKWKIAGDGTGQHIKEEGEE